MTERRQRRNYRRALTEEQTSRKPLYNAPFGAGSHGCLGAVGCTAGAPRAAVPSRAGGYAEPLRARGKARPCSGTLRAFNFAFEPFRRGIAAPRLRPFPRAVPGSSRSPSSPEPARPGSAERCERAAMATDGPGRSGVRAPCARPPPCRVRTAGGRGGGARGAAGSRKLRRCSPLPARPP